MSPHSIQFTGEPTPTIPIAFNEAVKKITSSWQKRTQSVLETARLVKEARDTFPGQTEALIKALPFERTQFQKLCKIGGDSRLYQERYIQKLPEHYSIIYELTKLDDSTFEAAMESGRIHPSMKRAEVAKLTKPVEPTSLQKQRSSLLKITVDWSLPEYQTAAFKKWLRDGQDQFKGIRINWLEDDFAASTPLPAQTGSTEPSAAMLAEIDAAMVELGLTPQN